MAKILLLEDDPDLLFTMTCALENEGHTVLGVTSVKDAICYLRFKNPDLMILDYMISSDTSLQVADFAMYAKPHLPIIYVTGSGLFSKGQLFNMVRNVSWVLRKPVKMRDLKEIVQFSLERGDTALANAQAG